MAHDDAGQVGFQTNDAMHMASTTLCAADSTCHQAQVGKPVFSSCTHAAADRLLLAPICLLPPCWHPPSCPHEVLEVDDGQQLIHPAGGAYEGIADAASASAIKCIRTLHPISASMQEAHAVGCLMMFKCLELAPAATSHKGPGDDAEQSTAWSLDCCRALLVTLCVCLLANSSGSPGSPTCCGHHTASQSLG
jgi:hypothetical protein